MIKCLREETKEGNGRRCNETQVTIPPSAVCQKEDQLFRGRSGLWITETPESETLDGGDYGRLATVNVHTAQR